jgi:hypothetical protein
MAGGPFVFVMLVVGIVVGEMEVEDGLCAVSAVGVEAGAVVGIAGAVAWMVEVAAPGVWGGMQNRCRTWSRLCRRVW